MRQRVFNVAHLEPEVTAAMNGDARHPRRQLGDAGVYCRGLKAYCVSACGVATMSDVPVSRAISSIATLFNGSCSIVETVEHMTVNVGEAGRGHA